MDTATLKWPGMTLVGNGQRLLNVFLSAIALAALLLHFDAIIDIKPVRFPVRTVPREFVSEARLTTEGIGSALQDIKVTLATAALFHANLRLPFQISTHGYDSSSYLMVNSPSVDRAHVNGRDCKLDEIMSNSSWKSLVNRACNSAKEFEHYSKILRKAHKDCRIVRDFETFNQGRHEDLNACTSAWIRQRLLAASRKKWGSSRFRSAENLVVYHNRAGDMNWAIEQGKEHSRTLPPEDARPALDNIQSKMKKRMKLLIVSEDKNRTHYEALNDYDFTFATGDTWLDEITQTVGARALVASGSSFGVLIAQVSGVKTIYAKWGGTSKYNNFDKFGVTVHELGEQGHILRKRRKRER